MTRSTTDVVIQSSVGGGPMSRLANDLSAAGVMTVVHTQFSSLMWRRLVRRRTGRVLARLIAFVVFPARCALRSRGGVAVPTTNPFILPLVVTAAKQLHRSTVLPLVYDLYPDVLEASGHAQTSSWAARFASRLNTYWLTHADGVVFIGHRMAEHVISRYREPTRWTVIETGASLREFADRGVPPRDLAQWCADRVICSYVGNLGHVHDWTTLASGVRGLSARRDLAVVVAASGPGVEYLRAAWRDLPSGFVRFTPPLDDSGWRWLLQRSDIALVTLKEEAALTSIPSKTFSAMAAAAAVVAVAPHESDLADVIDAHGCGVRVDPGDAEGLVGAISGLADDLPKLSQLKSRARRAVAAEYDTCILAEKWRRFIADCT